MTPLSIDVVSDVVCPWCFIGKRRLDAALALVPDIKATIAWRPFQLDPTIPRGGYDRQSYMLAKFGPQRLAASHERLVALGQTVGIDFAFDRIERAPNTLDAHRLIRWAQPMGRQTKVVEALFRAFFVEGRDIGDRAVLAELAEASGLDREATEARLDHDSDTAEVRSEIESAQRMGVNGVPFYILGNRYGVAGAQEAKHLAAALAEAAKATV